MSSKNIEMMKKIIEEKKLKGSNSKKTRSTEKIIGKTSKGAKVGNGGGLFDR